MSKQFDPYLTWLSVAPQDQPANHYRLLGLPEMIDDDDAIESAADRQMAHVRTFASGQHSELSQRILNEISKAKICLLNPQEKLAYDQALRAAATLQAPPLPPSQPVLKTRQAPQAHAPQAQPPAPATVASPTIASSPSARLKKKNSTGQQAAVVAGLLVVAVGLAWGFYLATSGDPVVAEHESDTGPPAAPPITDTPDAPSTVEPPKKTPPTTVVVDPPVRPDKTAPEDRPTPSVVDHSDEPPDPPAVGKPIDLLKRIDLSRDVVEGDWNIEGGVLVTPTDTNLHTARLMVAGTVPEEYSLTLEVERVSGDNSLVIGLVAEGKQIESYFDYHGPGKPSVSGLINGRQPTFSGALLKSGTPSVVRCRVSKSHIVIAVDDQTVFDGPRTGSMRVNREWAVPREDVLFLGSQSSSFRIHKFELTPLGDAAVAATDPPPATTEKLPLPEEPALAQAQVTLSDVFKDDLAAAKTSKDRIALAKTLLETSAEEGSDPAETYVMLRAARKLAAKAGDAKTALAAIDRLDEQFALDSLELKAEVLTEVAKSVRQLDDQAALVMLIGGVVLDMVDVDRFDLAEPLTKLAQSAATKSRNVALRKEVAASVKQFSVLRDRYQKVQPSFEKLKRMPDDAQANLAVGRYRAFVKRDWSAGLANLAAGSDEMLKALAKQDLAGADSPSDQVKLGDDWWKSAEAETGETQKALKIRAGHWYRKGQSGLTGLSKERISKRLDEIRALDPTGSINPADWIVRGWNRSKERWENYPLSKTTTDMSRGVLTVTNTTGIHSHAWIVFHPFVGDRPYTATLEMRSEFTGGRNGIGLASPDGQDIHLLVHGNADDQWHVYRIQRLSNGKFHFVRDGNSLPLSSVRFQRCGNGFVGQLGIMSESGKTFSIRRFILKLDAKE